MDLKIEKGIPMPGRGKTQITATLRQMSVGDSVFIPGLRSSAALGGRYVQLRPMRFCSRQVDGGIRVWRVE